MVCAGNGNLPNADMGRTKSPAPGARSKAGTRGNPKGAKASQNDETTHSISGSRDHPHIDSRRDRRGLRSATCSLGLRAKPRARRDPTVPRSLPSKHGSHADPARWLAAGDRSAAGTGATRFASGPAGTVEERDHRRGGTVLRGLPKRSRVPLQRPGIGCPEVATVNISVAWLSLHPQWIALVKVWRRFLRCLAHSLNFVLSIGSPSSLP
jgi:hypothetical protein